LTGYPVNVPPEDIVMLLASTGGSSTYIRDLTDLQWTLEPSALTRYLASFRSDQSRPLTSELSKRFFPSSTSSHAEAAHQEQAEQPSLRAWLELLLTAVREPRSPRRGDQATPDHDFLVTDDVLRALRLNTMWSAVFTSDQMAAPNDLAFTPHFLRPGSAHLAHRRVPASVREILRLLAQRDGAFVRPVDYPSDAEDGAGVGHLSWYLRRERILLTVYSRSRDHWPGFSSLNLFGWFGHMMLSVTSAKQTIHLIAEEVASKTMSDKPDLIAVARSAHRSFLELEELYDLDIAWPTYQLFYERLRELTGLNEEYRRARDRIELLTHFSEIELRTSGDRIARVLAALAILFAILIGFASLASFFVAETTARHLATHRWLEPTAVVILAAIIVAVLYVAWPRLRVRRKA
jgi:hypothetical protein